MESITTSELLRTFSNTGTDMNTASTNSYDIVIPRKRKGSNESSKGTSNNEIQSNESVTINNTNNTSASKEHKQEEEQDYQENANENVNSNDSNDDIPKADSKLIRTNKKIKLLSEDPSTTTTNTTATLPDSSTKIKTTIPRTSAKISSSEKQEIIIKSPPLLNLDLPIQLPIPELAISDHPLNRMGYKYTCAQLDPLMKYSEFHERQILPSNQSFSFLNSIDSNTFLQVNENLTQATTNKGWCSIRGGCGVKTGCWYYEVKILNGGGEGKISNRTGAHCRIGWGRREAFLDCPTGSDDFSYGYRDYSGDIFHQARPKRYGESFSTGDVIGCFIQLGDYHPTMNWPVGEKKRPRFLIKYKGNIYYESTEYAHFTKQEILEAVENEKKEIQAKAEQEEMEKKRNEEQEDQQFQLKGKKSKDKKNKSKKDENHQQDISDENKSSRKALANKNNTANYTTTNESGSLQEQYQQSNGKPRQETNQKQNGNNKTNSANNIIKKENSKKISKEQQLKELEKQYSAFTSLFQEKFVFNQGEECIPLIQDSNIQFFKNGVSHGIAFNELPVPVSAAGLIPPNKRKPKEAFLPPPPFEDDGSLGYYPIISVFKQGKVQVNFGPHFEYPPPKQLNARPLIERLVERDVENYLADLVDETELQLTLMKRINNINGLGQIDLDKNQEKNRVVSLESRGNEEEGGGDDRKQCLEEGGEEQEGENDLVIDDEHHEAVGENESENDDEDRNDNNDDDKQQNDDDDNNRNEEEEFEDGVSLRDREDAYSIREDEEEEGEDDGNGDQNEDEN